jgi:PAS domain S-box-containing protein
MEPTPPLIQSIPLDTLVRSTRQGVLILNTRTDTVLAFNERFCELWHLLPRMEEMRQGEIKGRDILEHASQLVEDPLLVMEMYQRIQEEGAWKETETDVTFRDGQILRCLSRPLYDTENDYLGRLCTFDDVTERHRAEKARRESERRFRTMLETVQQIAVLLNRDGNIVFVNEYFLNLTGSLRSEVVGQNWFDRFMPPFERDRVRRDFQAHLEQGYIEPHGENHIVTRQGECRLISWNNTVLRDAQGCIVGTASLGVDVTELRRAEQELRDRHQSEAQFRARLAALYEVTMTLTRCASEEELYRQAILLGREQLGFDRLGLWFSAGENSIVGSYGTDENGQLRDERDSRVELKPDYVIYHILKGKSRFGVAMDVRLANHQAEIVGRGWQASAALWDSEQIIGYLSADNLLQKRPYSEQDGEILSLYASVLGHLISRKRLETAQQEREALYRRAIAAADAVAYQTEEATRTYRFIDSDIERLTGVSADQMLLETWEQMGCETIMRGECEGLSLEEAQKRLQAGQLKVWKSDIYWRQADGSPRWLADTSVPLFDAQGNFTGALGILQDITERKALEEQFLQAQKMESLGRLAGGIAHDFNNLLTAIMGYTELTEMTLPPDSPAQPYLKHVQAAAERAAKLTGQLLAFARKQVITPRVVVLNTLIEEFNPLIERLLGKQIKRIETLETGLWSVRIDPVQFEQALLNLVINARDAMPEGGTLRIQTRNLTLTDDSARKTLPLVPGDYVEFSVSDTGTGIEDAVLPHIFEPFFTTKEVGKGTGLGLATVHGIVRQNSGLIEVQSQPGEGATFTIYLPRVTAVGETGKK